MSRSLVVALALAVSAASAAYAPPSPVPLRPVQPLQPQPQAVNPVAPGKPVVPVQPQIVTPTAVKPQTPAPEFQQNDVNVLQPTLEYVDYEDDDEDAPGFVVQNGIEGYIVPASLLETTKIEPALSFLQKLGVLFGLTKLPKFAIALFPKLVFLFKHFGLLLLLGGALTTAVCTFTPFCGIALGVRTENEIFSLRNKAWDTASFVINSIDKYREIAKNVEEEEQTKKSKKRRR